MRLTIVPLAFVLALTGCPHLVAPECETIAHRCHGPAESPDATATQRECHESAENSWSGAECTANQPRCFAACPETGDGGH
jgi:hypothetical protein